jgi:hypothetical protein
MTARTKVVKNAPPIASPVVRVNRSSRRNRKLARENPESFPEVSNRQLLADLEDDSLDIEGED